MRPLFLATVGLVAVHWPRAAFAHSVGAEDGIWLWVDMLAPLVSFAALGVFVCTSQRGVRVLREIVRARWRRFLALWATVFAAYQFLLLAPFLISFQTKPNYAKVYDVWGGIGESFQVQPPLVELLKLVTDQPVYEFGVEDPFGFIPIQFVAEVHSLFTMVVLPPLVALSMVLQLHAWKLLRQARRRTVGAVAGGTPLVASLFGATTSAVACCGASAGPVFLSLLGLGFGVGGVIVDYAGVLEALGFAVLIGNVIGFSMWLAHRWPDSACQFMG